MNKTNYLTFSGMAMALAGIFMLISANIGIGTAKFLVPAMFALGGIMAWLFSEANKHHKIARPYHLLQGVSMVAFAFLIGVMPNTLAEFLRYITYFMGFFGLIEILFGFMALNSGHKLNISILISRFVAGFFNLIGAVLILATVVTDELSGLLIAGTLVLLGGLAFVIFAFRIRNIKVRGGAD